ncbi:hypothetical protein I545_4725 [Mycobacterium kansasii 662]|uniref:Uncharacterized protein n=2 Tax=Mycobacterium kansasii TaxID=1768 RepID=A0A1V3WX90_MYCKA|nr:hypothetical protein I547_2543 [Mycobacterium kansasii 824]EUA13384.1 hypothetical protein I545_4725 [Mycobacterium kansasii 662]OOK71560.1 hypothetical protein BZL29_5671 [Mycobacterium kansasii]
MPTRPSWRVPSTAARPDHTDAAPNPTELNHFRAGGTAAGTIFR